MNTVSTKHTPGPWYTHECDNATKEEINIAVEIRHKNQLLADIYIGNSNQELEEEWVEIIDIDEARANAKLIASAPELLAERDKLKEENEALKNKLDSLTKYGAKIIEEKAKLQFLNKELLGASKELIQAMNQKQFFMEGYKNGSASISEVTAASDDEYKAYSKLFAISKAQSL